MDNLEKIEAAIEKLPDEQVRALAAWMDALQAKRASSPRVEKWLERAVGAAKPGITTDDVMKMTRGED